MSAKEAEVALDLAQDMLQILRDNLHIPLTDVAEGRFSNIPICIDYMLTCHRACCNLFHACRQAAEEEILHRSASAKRQEQGQIWHRIYCTCSLMICTLLALLRPMARPSSQHFARL